MQQIVKPLILIMSVLFYVLSAGTAHTNDITFTLVNASTDQNITKLVDEATINLAETGQELNIRADIGIPVDHVRFEVDGIDFRTEKKIPYALAGDDAGNYTSWTPEVGHYTLQATAYDATDNEVASKIIYFTVVDNATDAGSFTKTAKQNESFQPLGHKWREVIWGYDENPCNNYVYRDAYFPDIGNEDREVVSAKLYVNAHYGFGPMPPYCPPGEDCDEEDDERASLLSTCDGSKFHKFIYGGETLPNNKWKEFDLPLRYFECGKKERSYGARLKYHKTNVVNQHAQLAGLRLEIEFGDICEKPEPEDPPEPEEPEEPEVDPWLGEQIIGESKYWTPDNNNYMEDAGFDNFETVSGDYNGDGKDDVALVTDYGNTTTRVHVFLSDGEKFQFLEDQDWWSSTDFDAKKVAGKITSGDYNNDGLDDIAWVYTFKTPHYEYETADVLFSTGSTFQYRFRFGAWEKPAGAGNMISRPVTGDFNANDIDDIMVFYIDSSQRPVFQLLSSTGEDFLEYPWVHDLPAGTKMFNVGRRIAAGDFNGDGFDDITMVFSDYGPLLTTNALVFLSTGQGFQAHDSKGWWQSFEYSIDKVQDIVVGNYNGDAFDDISFNVFDRYEKNNVPNNRYIIKLLRNHVLYSSGTAFQPMQESHVYASIACNLASTPPCTNDTWTNRFASGDFDGDGLDNVLNAELEVRSNYDNKVFGVDVLFF